MRCRSVLLCAAGNAAATAAAAASLMEKSPEFAARVATMVRGALTKGSTFDGLALLPDEATGRGVFADCAYGEGATLLSVPLDGLSISSHQLLRHSPELVAMRPPSLDEVAHLMTSRSIQDPVLFDQVHLALLLAGERMRGEASPHAAYLDALPYPALDDAAVIGRHKDALDPMVLVEWDDYQKEFLAILHIMLRRWGPHAPPVEVAYWALRTTMCRMHMLPADAVAPTDMGSALNYAALNTVDQADRQHRWVRRVKAAIGAVTGNPTAGEEYRLAPTLVPILDMVGHLPSGNVRVEIASRPEVGSCVELHAVRPIDQGEEIGLRFNSCQTEAFLLYRFGFIPH